MNSTPTPGIGCFSASYPNIVWIPERCSPPPKGAETVGNGNDDSANNVLQGIATNVHGSFPSLTGYSSECDPSWGCDYYSLQLNTNEFPQSVYGPCGSGQLWPNGWEQFVLKQQGNVLGSVLFIEYWLIQYHMFCGNCPPNWSQDPLNANNCFLNSAAATDTNYRDPAHLTNYMLTGNITSTMHSAVFCDSGVTPSCYADTVGAVLPLYNNWSDTEFGIFGFQGNSQANFNSGVTLGVKVDNNAGSVSCGTLALTGETNNLNLGSCVASGTAVTISESN